MVFNSQEFLIFFPLVLIVYSIIPKKMRCIWLLLASYYFYMNWNAKYGVLLALTTLISYVAGILLENKRTQSVRKLILAVSVCSNLGILCAFKYLNFLIENINSLFSQIGGGNFVYTTT